MTFTFDTRQIRMWFEASGKYFRKIENLKDWEIRSFGITHVTGLRFSWCRYQMETISALLVHCMRIHGSPLNSSHKGQWRRALMFSLICVWTNGWVNYRDAGDLRRRRPHYDVTVMFPPGYHHRAGGPGTAATRHRPEWRWDTLGGRGHWGRHQGEPDTGGLWLQGGDLF